jgi:hypothetical protein
MISLRIETKQRIMEFVDNAKKAFIAHEIELKVIRSVAVPEMMLDCSKKLEYSMK